MKRYAGKMEPLENTALAARITAALERRAEPEVPADFAARVMKALPAVKPVRRRLRLGRMVAMFAMAVTLIAIAVLAGRTSPSFSSMAFDAELLLMVELAAIASWLVLKGHEV